MIETKQVSKGFLNNRGPFDIATPPPNVMWKVQQVWETESEMEKGGRTIFFFFQQGPSDMEISLLWPPRITWIQSQATDIFSFRPKMPFPISQRGGTDIYYTDAYEF